MDVYCNPPGGIPCAEQNGLRHRLFYCKLRETRDGNFSRGGFHGDSNGIGTYSGSCRCGEWNSGPLGGEDYIRSQPSTKEPSAAIESGETHRSQIQ